MKDPLSVVSHTRLFAELQQGNACLCFAIQIYRNEPDGQEQLGRLSDRACHHDGLVVALTRLKAPEPPSVHQPMRGPLAASVTKR